MSIDKTVQDIMSAAPTESQESASAELVLTRASDIKPERVRWLWKNRIALGKLTVFAGDPTAGKSYATCAVAAALSKGVALPDHDGPQLGPCEVLLQNYEDGDADTIVPRLMRCGADLRNVFVVEGLRYADESLRTFTIRDVAPLERTLDQHPNVKMLVVDPMGAAVPGVNTHKDADVRAALAPLAALAGRRGIAIVLVMHLNKAEALKALYRLGGSIAWMGLPRTALLFAPDGENSQRVCASFKNILGPTPSSLGYRISAEGFEWLGTVDRTAQQLLEPPPPAARAKRRSAAEELILEMLDAGNGQRPASEVIEEAERRGISRATLHRARTKLGLVPTNKQGMGAWVWSLTEDTTSPDTRNVKSSVSSTTDEIFEDAEHVEDFKTSGEDELDSSADWLVFDDDDSSSVPF